MTRARLIGALGVTVIAASVVFLVWQLGDLVSEAWTSGLSSGELVRLAAAFPVYLLALGCVHVAWAMLAVTGRPPVPSPFPRACALTFRAQIAKYMPGNVFHFAGRQLLASRLAWPQATTAGASMVEVLGLPFVASLIVVFGLAARSDPGAPEPAFGVPPFVILLVVAGVIVACATAATLWRGAAPLRAGLWSWRGVVVVVFALYATFFLSAGLAQALLLPDAAVGAVVVASAAAWVSGYLAPGVPAGIGVREAVFVLMLGADDVTVAVAVLGFRLLMVLSDVALFAAGLGIEHHFVRRDAMSVDNVRPDS